MGKVGKVVICGMKGCGKTAILEQLIYGNITPDSVSHVHFTLNIISIRLLFVFIIYFIDLVRNRIQK